MKESLQLLAEVEAHNEEGWSRDRYGCDGWRHHLRAANFTELLHYYCPPGLPCHRQPWLAMVWRKM